MARDAAIDVLIRRIESIGFKDKESECSGIRENQDCPKCNTTEFDEDKDQKAYLKALRMLDSADRSSYMLEKRLIKAGYSESAALSAVKRCCSSGIVDDKRYGQALVRARLAQGKGIQGIERELLENRIDPEDIEGWPDEFLNECEPEEDRAKAFLEKHPPRAKNLRDCAYRKLIAKGYSSSVASKVAREWARLHCNF